MTWVVWSSESIGEFGMILGKLVRFDAKSVTWILGGLSVLYLLLVVRAHAARVWARPVSAHELAWLVMGWVSGIAVMLVAMGVAWWRPVGGLIILAVSVVLGPLAARWSSAAYPLRASGR